MIEFNNFEEAAKQFGYARLLNLDDHRIFIEKPKTIGDAYRIPGTEKTENPLIRTSLEEIIIVNLVEPIWKGEKWDINSETWIKFDTEEEYSKLYNSLKTLHYIGSGQRKAELAKIDGQTYAIGLVFEQTLRISGAVHRLMQESIDQRNYSTISSTDLHRAIRIIDAAMEDYEKYHNEGALMLSGIGGQLKSAKRILSGKYFQRNPRKDYMKKELLFPDIHSAWYSGIAVKAPEKMIRYYEEQNPVNKTKEHEEFIWRLDRMGGGCL